MTEPGRRRAARWWAATAATTGTELRRWRRQKVAVACTLVLPLAVAALVSAALGDDLSDYHTDLAVVDLDGGPVADAFVQEALGRGSVADVVDVHDVATAAEARHQVADGDVGAAIILEPGLSSWPGADGARRIEVVPGSDDRIAGDLAALVVEVFETRATAAAVALPPPAGSGPAPWPLELDVEAIGGGRLTPAAHYGPALALFFVLLTLGFAASRLVADRQRGVVDRLATTPVPGSAVLAGRAAAGLVVGAVTFAVVAVAMPVLFGDRWGPPGAVLAVGAASVVALAGLAALVAALARSTEQAQALTVTASFVLLLASGAMAPPGAATRPATARLVPLTYSLDAYATLTTGAGGLGAVAPSILAVSGFGVAYLAAAFALTGRRVSP